MHGQCWGTVLPSPPLRCCRHRAAAQRASAGWPGTPLKTLLGLSDHIVRQRGGQNSKVGPACDGQELTSGHQRAYCNLR